MFNRKKMVKADETLLQRSWGGLLLLIFLFPQINNALHYFVVKHNYNHSHTNQLHNNEKTHDCELSIYKMPSVLLFDFGYTEPKKNILFSKVDKPFFISFYTRTFFKILSDRGPPVDLVIKPLNR